MKRLVDPKPAPLNTVLQKAMSLMAICNEVKKHDDDGYIAIAIVCGHGALTITVKKEAGLHQVVRVALADASVGKTENYEALHDNGDRLDVSPMMLFDLNQRAPTIGKLLARLLQSDLVADGETNHGPRLRGYLASARVVERSLAGMSV